MANTSYSRVDRLRRRAQLYESLAGLEPRRADHYRQKAQTLRQQLEQAQSHLPQTGFQLQKDNVLEVQDLCMYFGGVRAVDGLSFQVKKGYILLQSPYLYHLSWHQAQPYLQSTVLPCHN